MDVKCQSKERQKLLLEAPLYNTILGHFLKHIPPVKQPTLTETQATLSYTHIHVWHIYPSYS